MSDSIVKREQVYRLIELFITLARGGSLYKRELADKYGVSLKSIQRDIDFLKYFISERYAFSEAENIVYDRKNNRYYWHTRNDLLLNDDEVVLLATMLLGCRSLPKSEVDEIIKRLENQCSQENLELVKAVISNEQMMYSPVHNSKAVGKAVLDISMARMKHLVVEVVYKSLGNTKPKVHQLIPLGIMFSEMYFYLIAKEYGTEDEAVIYRLDRVISYTILSEVHFREEYAERFQTGEFRKVVPFMWKGEETKMIDIKFRFFGESLEAVMDKLPTAKVLEHTSRGDIISAKAYGRGLKLWLLSQGEYLEVLEPPEFRQEMAETIAKMAKLY